MKPRKRDLKWDFMLSLVLAACIFAFMAYRGEFASFSAEKFASFAVFVVPLIAAMAWLRWSWATELGRIARARRRAAKLARGMIIAVDGPTASGKGTIAKAIAEHFELPYLDTGLLYRAVGYQTVADGGDPDNPDQALAACDFRSDLLRSSALRSEEVGGYASRVSSHPDVRKALYERQRAFAEQPGGAVLDGRDIGTVIAPEADVKLFITASVQERAKRRWMEMRGREIDIPLADIERDIAVRDSRDINRADAPLRAAPDALVIDTTSFGKDEAIEAAIEAVTEALR